MPVLILSFKSLFTEISIGESFFLQNIGDAIREKSNKNSQYIFIKRPPISNQNRSLHILRSAFFFCPFSIENIGTSIKYVHVLRKAW